MKRLCFIVWLALLTIGASLPPSQVAQFFAETSVSAAGYTPDAAQFDGSNDYTTKASAMTGFADGKLMTLAVWINLEGGDGTQMGLVSSFSVSATVISISRTTGNAIRVFLRNSVPATVVDATTSVTKVAADGWFHFMVCVDTANAANRHIYFDGTEDASVTWTTYVADGIIDFAQTSPSFYIGSLVSGGSKLNGSLSEFWWNDTYLDDPTKFVSGGSPVDLGVDGSTPSGTAPALYLSTNGSGDSWATDSSGNANDFTVTGALGSPTPP